MSLRMAAIVRWGTVEESTGIAARTEVVGEGEGEGMVCEIDAAVAVGFGGTWVLVDSTWHAASSAKAKSNATADVTRRQHDMSEFYQH